MWIVYDCISEGLLHDGREHFHFLASVFSILNCDSLRYLGCYIYIYPKLSKSWKIEVFQQRLKLGMKDLKRVTVFDLSWNLYICHVEVI